MPQRNRLTAWKRKKVAVERRIKELEAVRKLTTKWLSKVGQVREGIHLWERKDYLRFLERDDPERVFKLKQETALKLDYAKQELHEINKKIAGLKQRRKTTVPLAIALALIMVVGLGTMFFESGITGMTVAEFGMSIEGLDNFKASEQPVFKISIDDGRGLLTGMFVGPPAEQNITATLKDPSGKERILVEEIVESEEGFTIALEKGREFRAGKYTLTVTTSYGGEEYTEEQDFTWGVLAINTHKSIYLPEEEAFIGMAVLDDEGAMVCNASVTLEVTSPTDEKTTLSTENGLIKVSPECEVYGVTNLPDYYTYYNVSGAGNYTMKLTAVTYNGVRSLIDEFIVQETVEFDVTRQGATRIYPVVP